MEIRDDSWHHKLYKVSYMGGWPSTTTNLCSYFWRTVFGLAIAAVFVAVVAIFLGAVGIIFYRHTAVCFMVLGTIGTLAGLGWLWYYISEKRYEARGYKDAEPGLIRSYLRAKKEKVCPIVEIV